MTQDLVTLDHLMPPLETLLAHFREESAPGDGHVWAQKEGSAGFYFWCVGHCKAWGYCQACLDDNADVILIPEDVQPIICAAHLRSGQEASLRKVFSAIEDRGYYAKILCKRCRRTEMTEAWLHDMCISCAQSPFDIYIGRRHAGYCLRCGFLDRLDERQHCRVCSGETTEYPDHVGPSRYSRNHVCFLCFGPDPDERYGVCPDCFVKIEGILKVPEDYRGRFHRH